MALLTSDKDESRESDFAISALYGKFTPLSEVFEYGDHRLQRHGTRTKPCYCRKT